MDGRTQYRVSRKCEDCQTGASDWWTNKDWFENKRNLEIFKEQYNIKNVLFYKKNKFENPIT